MKTSRFARWLKDEREENRLLFHSVPAVFVALFVVAEIGMNLLANKAIVSLSTKDGLQWFGLDAGILLSWLAFLCMDVLTKRFGAKAADKVSLFAILCNVLFALLLFAVSYLPDTADYSALDSVFRGTPAILLASVIASLASAFLNNGLNALLGRAFKDRPDSRGAFFVRLFVSTFVGQILDNFLFSVLAYRFFLELGWWGDKAWMWSYLACFTSALTGALVELLSEVLFAPLGYRVSRQWEKEGVGKEYLDFVAKRKEEEKR